MRASLRTAAMNLLMQALPGIPLPVAEVTGSLGRMWDADNTGEGAPSEFRASQMNLVLHFGLTTTALEARGKFDEAIAFSQRYPTRIVVLCPEERRDGAQFLEGKLFAQCYIGDTIRTMCCCEALMLGYPTNEADFLENQVSIWLESDLPTCLWFHRVPAERIRNHYLGFARQMKRVIFDSSVEGPDPATLPWDKPRRVRDLARARSLPVRQSIGQFLSAYAPATLVDGLESLAVHSPPGRQGEASSLMDWFVRAVEKCRGEPLPPEAIDLRIHPDSPADSICVRWRYTNGKAFLADIDFATERGEIRADFTGRRIIYPFGVKLFGPREALSEAVFF